MCHPCLWFVLLFNTFYSLFYLVCVAWTLFSWPHYVFHFCWVYNVKSQLKSYFSILCWFHTETQPTGHNKQLTAQCRGPWHLTAHILSNHVTPGTGANPYIGLEKTSVLQETRTFNETPLSNRKCIQVLAKIIFMINQVSFTFYHT